MKSSCRFYFKYVLYLDSLLLPNKTVDRELAQQVGQHLATEVVAVGVIHHATLQDADAETGTQLLEILKSAEVDVGGVIPLVW